jgi:hypothetical protein
VFQQAMRASFTDNWTVFFISCTSVPFLIKVGRLKQVQRFPLPPPFQARLAAGLHFLQAQHRLEFQDVMLTASEVPEEGVSFRALLSSSSLSRSALLFDRSGPENMHRFLVPVNFVRIGTSNVGDQFAGKIDHR